MNAEPEFYCDDCHHRRGVHWLATFSDGHGDRAFIRARCGLAGCACLAYAVGEAETDSRWHEDADDAEVTR